MAISTTELEPDFRVGGQIRPDDVAGLKADGVGMIVNNRPDDEEDGQPTSAAIADAAEAAGIAYAHVPIGRGISPADIDAETAALAGAGDAKIFAFCRSGMRSTMLWALARHAEGRDADQLRAKAEAAGYSLDPIDHLL